MVDYEVEEDESDEEAQDNSSQEGGSKSPSSSQLPTVECQLPDSGSSGSCAVDSTSTSEKAGFDDQEDVVPSLPEERMSAVSSSDCPMIPDIFTISGGPDNSVAVTPSSVDQSDDRLMFNDLLSGLAVHKSLNGAADSAGHVRNGPSHYPIDNSSEVSPPTSPLGTNNEAEPSAASLTERLEAEPDFCLLTNAELSLNAAAADRFDQDNSAMPSTVASVDADSSVSDTPQVKRPRLVPPEGLPVPMGH